MRESSLQKSDYEEPCCPLATPTDVHPISVGRVIEKLDAYLGKNDYDGAERHLAYWIEEAEVGNDQRGKLSLLNEQIGLYRKRNRPQEGLAAIRAALSLAEELGMENTVTYGTTLINAATAYKAFGKAAEALPLYRRATEIYESSLKRNDPRLGGLYNNTALTVMELGDLAEAKTLFTRALSVMAEQEHGEAEMAITYCNLCDLAVAEQGMEAAEPVVREYLDRAENLLDTETLPRNGYYAFICEKCAPTFGYYGYFLTEQKFTERAREIYAGN